VKPNQRVAAFICLIGTISAAWAAGPSARVAVEVPPEIKQALDREVGSGRILGLSSDQDENKKVIYVAHAQIEGWAYTIRFDLDGTLIDDECDEPDPDPRDITLADLPPVVAAKLKAESGGAALTDPSRQDFQAVYEIHATIGTHSYSIRVDGDGKLLSKERDDDESRPKKSA
jgi:hypothetical protein